MGGWKKDFQIRSYCINSRLFVYKNMIIGAIKPIALRIPEYFHSAFTIDLYFKLT